AKVLHIISSWKNDCLSYEDVEGTGNSFIEREHIRLFGEYQKRLKSFDAMDFDDLILNVNKLFQKRSEVLEKYRNIFKYILVDEYQDTNKAQFVLVRMLSEKHRNIFVVGDDDQSIYGWRGARVENILSFNKEFPEASVYKLEDNYRSSQSILDFANDIIKYVSVRSEKNLNAALDASGEDVRIERCSDDRDEARKVTERLKSLVGNGKSGYSEIAVIFRTNAQSRVFEEIMLSENIPYTVIGGTGFYDRKEIKDCMAYLSLILNQKDDLSCERIINRPARGIGKKSIERLETGTEGILNTVLTGSYTGIKGKAAKSIEEFRDLYKDLIRMEEKGDKTSFILSEVMDRTGYVSILEKEDTDESLSRVDNINELFNAVFRWEEDNPEKGLRDFLEEVSLTTDLDRHDSSSEKVSLMTFHAAKGLEYGTVFLTGIEDGIIPSVRNLDDRKALDEECRLLYVGSTRAKKHLSISFAEFRRRFGIEKPMSPSRFIKSYIPERSPLHSNRRPDRSIPFGASGKKYSGGSSGPGKEYEDYSQETVEYSIGEVVEHDKFGKGKIMNIDGQGKNMRLTILFENGVRKKIVAGFVKQIPAYYREDV
ncbi:MAG: ATP-dependent helicase, partial [Chitinivibrionales bacterium]